MHTSYLLYRIDEPNEYQVIFYRTPRGSSPTDDFLDSLNKKARAKVLKWLKLLQEQGPSLPRPFSGLLENSIYELRIGFGRLEIRLLYFFCKG